MSDSKCRTDATQAVYEAAHQAWVRKDDPEHIAAATLRAVVDQIPIWPGIPRNEYSTLLIQTIDGQLRAIATELEGSDG